MGPEFAGFFILTFVGGIVYFAYAMRKKRRHAKSGAPGKAAPALPWVAGVWVALLATFAVLTNAYLPFEVVAATWNTTTWEEKDMLYADDIWDRPAEGLKTLKLYEHANLGDRINSPDTLLDPTPEYYVGTLYSWQWLLSMYEKRPYRHEEYLRSLKEYRRILPTVLKRNYPVARKAAIESWRETMRDKGVSIVSRGDYAAVRFIGDRFADTTSIQQFHKDFLEYFTAARIKRVEYAEREDQKECTLWIAVASPPDDYIMPVE